MFPLKMVLVVIEWLAWLLQDLWVVGSILTIASSILAWLEAVHYKIKIKNNEPWMCCLRGN